MIRLVFPAIMFMQIMNLCVAVMARRNTVIRFCIHYLLIFSFAVSASGFGKSRLQKPAAATTAVVVRLVGRHFYKIFRAHNCLNNIPKVLRHRIAQTLANQLARVLYGKFYSQIFVPVGINLQFPFPDPLGIILNNTLGLKIVLDVEFFQSGPDCVSDVPSLGVEVDLAPQGVGLTDAGGDRMFPAVVVGQEHAVVFSAPALAAIGPVGSYEM